jgi:multicomponent Na+:H+ antiporter subunit E
VKTDGNTKSGKFNGSAFIATFVILLGTWLVLSGQFDSFHITLGLACCLLVSYFSHDLLFPVFEWGKSSTVFFRFMSYLPWLFYQILLANLHVAKMVLHPRMPINPGIVEFKTKLKSGLAMTTLANSITLTPGTITIDIRDGKYYVHALTKKVTDDLLSGEMENRVASIYDELEGN